MFAELTSKGPVGRGMGLLAHHLSPGVKKELSWESRAALRVSKPLARCWGALVPAGGRLWSDVLVAPGRAVSTGPGNQHVDDATDFIRAVAVEVSAPEKPQFVMCVAQ